MPKTLRKNWSSSAEARFDQGQNLSKEADKQANESQKHGKAGDEVRKAQAITEDNINLSKAAAEFIKPKDIIEFLSYDWIADQGASDSSLVIGPIRYSYSVQQISAVERKAAYTPRLLRSDRPLVLDSGKSEHRANIRLIFSGVDEINKFLRPLILLFKVCPIISIRNEAINGIWDIRVPKLQDLAKKAAKVAQRKFPEKAKKITNIYQNIKQSIKDGSFEKEILNSDSSVYKDILDISDLSGIKLDDLFFVSTSGFIPVCLDKIELQTAPDLPETVIVNLEISRIELESINEIGALEYLTKEGSYTVNPRQAFWLKKYIIEVLANDSVIAPMISSSDFDTVKLRFFEKSLEDLRPMADKPKDIILNSASKKLSTEKGNRVVGQSASMYNHFSKFSMIGKPIVTAQHMGRSSRHYSIDIESFEDDFSITRLQEIKEWSDKIIRSDEFNSRILGWEVISPLTILLGSSLSTENYMRHGAYTMLTFQMSSADTPFRKDIAMSFAETNTEFLDDIVIELEKGGLIIDDLKTFFFGTRTKVTKGNKTEKKETYKDPIGIVPGQRKARGAIVFKKLISGFVWMRNNVNRTGIETVSPWESSAYKIFWPIDSEQNIFTYIVRPLSIINRDTIRAALFDTHMDPGGTLATIARKTPIISGSVETESPPNIFEKVGVAAKALIQAVHPPEDLKREISKKVDKMFSSPIREDLKERIERSIFLGLIGHDSSIDTIIKIMNSKDGGDIEFSNDFLKALFNVIIRRPSPPYGLKRVYDKAGLFSAFMALYGEYKFDRHLYPPWSEENSLEAVLARITSKIVTRKPTTYRDFSFLPTYEELFGDNWKKFAPTYKDVGRLADDEFISRATGFLGKDGLQKFIAVTGDTVVPPHIFFYKRRHKDSLSRAFNSLLDDPASILNSTDTLYLSMNLSRLRDVKKLKELEGKTEELEEIINIDDLNQASDTTKETIESLVDIIIDGYKAHNKEFDEAAFDSDLRKIEALQEVAVSSGISNISRDIKAAKFKIFKDTFLDENSPNALKIYMTTTATESSKKTGYVFNNIETSPLLGGALIRVLHSQQHKIKERVGYSVMGDQPLKTNFMDTKDAFVRGTRDSTKEAIKDNLRQVPDTFRSIEKLWPVVKFYFVERRGNSILGEDIMHGTNSVLSIEITLDKQDASTAVIKIADPLRILQQAEFLRSPIISRENSPTVVLPSPPPQSRNKKVDQGVGVVIKMGYDSSPDNLETVFTGRIAEIEPGDVLTLVCQEWKAELINRQVNFYTSARRDRSPSDIAILAIQLADPAGFGEHISHLDLILLLSRIENLPFKDLLTRLKTLQSGTTPIHGFVPFFKGILESIVETVDFFNFFEFSKDDIGIDTRLKNIWYPDINHGIFTGGLIRRIFGFPPEFTTNYWISPVQPAWNVLQEAARHTWHYICQTTPFDSESTIFFGHPDQFYYYSREKSEAMAIWRKYALSDKKRLENMKDLINKLTTTTFKDDKDFPYTSPLRQLANFIIPTNKYIRLDNQLIRGIVRKYYTLSISKKVKQNIQYKQFDISFGPLEWLRKTADFAGITAIKRIVGETTPFEQISRLREVYKPFLKEVQKDALKYFNLLKESYFGENFSLILLSMFYGVDPAKIIRLWPTYRRDVEAILAYDPEEGDIPENLSFKEAAERSFSISYKYRSLLFSVEKNQEPFSILERANMVLPEEDRLYIGYDESFGNLLEKTQGALKLFVILLYSRVLKTHPKDRLDLKDEINIASMDLSLKVFRVHHYVDDVTDIISNEIVASTAKMWNTVIINHPKDDPSDRSNVDSDNLGRGVVVKGNVSWVYWPPASVSKVLGLQFHPALSIQNKKVRVFTELNCITPELAAKIACNRLAEGLRYMYDGSLIIRGRVIKPYDIAILNDYYSDIKGPIEIGSVVHHFTPEMGWITNIKPCALCESNPSASIIQAAIAQGAYEVALSVTETAFKILDWLIILSIISGIGSPAAIAGSALKVAGGTLKSILERKIINVPGILKDVALLLGNELDIKLLQSSSIKLLQNTIKKRGVRYSLSKLAVETAKRAGLGRAINGYLTNQLLYGATRRAISLAGNYTITTAWIEGSKNKAKQLPVILSPLLLGGDAWTAGLEAQDDLFVVPFYDTYYSLVDMKEAVMRFLFFREPIEEVEILDQK